MTTHASRQRSSTGEVHQVIAHELRRYGLKPAAANRLAARILDTIDGTLVPPATLSQWSTRRLRAAYMVQRYKRSHLRHERDAVTEALRQLVAAIDNDPTAVAARITEARRVLRKVPGGAAR